MTAVELARLQREDREDRIYPCDKCGLLRSKDEGGAIFTVCDACWGSDPPSGSEYFRRYLEVSQDRDRLAARIAELEKERDGLAADVERLRIDLHHYLLDWREMGAGLATYRSMCDEAVKARDKARARLAVVEPVYEAAKAWRDHPYQNDFNSDACDRSLIDAVDRALSTTPTPEVPFVLDDPSLPCVHGRGDWRVCPHCIGLNTASMPEVKT